MSAETYGVAAARAETLPNLGMRRRDGGGMPARRCSDSNTGGSPRSPMSLPQRMLTQSTIGLVEPGWPAFWAVVLQDTVAWTFVSLMFTDLAAAYFNGGTDPCLGEGRGTPRCDSALSTLSRTSVFFGTMSALLGTVSGPLVGCMADVVGTKTVLVTSLTLRMAQFIAFFGLTFGKMSIYFYFIAQEFAALVYSGLAYNLWVIENTPPASRVTTIARLGAVLSLEGVVVPVVVMWSPPHIAPFVVMLLGSGSILAAYFGMPQREVSPAVQLAVKNKGIVAVCRKHLTEAWGFLTADGNKIMILCTICGQTVSFGLGGVWYLFLKARFGLGMHELAHYAALSSVFFISVQVVIVPSLQPILGLRTMISVGIVFALVTELLYMFLPSRSWLWVAIMLSALASLNGPAIAAMVSNLATSSSVSSGNSAQASVNSVNAIACLISPLLFQGVFSHFLRPNNILFESAWPGAVYGLGFLLSSFALFLVQVIPESTFEKAEALCDGDERTNLSS